MMWTILLRPLRTGGAVLCFHSVTTPALPAEGSAHVPVETFTSLVSAARLFGEIVPLSELVRRHREGRNTSGMIAVTFDDAYAALRTELSDVIARQQIPVTVFVVADAAATGARYWWDRVDDLFPRVAADRWRSFEAACGLTDEYREGQPREYGPLRPLRQWLLATHAGRWPAHLDTALDVLEQETGRRTLHRSMTFEELSEFAAQPWVELGVHTVSHPVLPLLPDHELAHEIAASHDALRERFSAGVVPILAVPFGLYDERTIRMSRAAGMVASLTLGGVTFNVGTAKDTIPRFCVATADTSVRLGIRLLGVRDLMRSWSRSRPAAYPDLPSPTS
jgi:peptidoglycan/xylan/chitin deacetylase (PgdA/CDA1 family)